MRGLPSCAALSPDMHRILTYIFHISKPYAESVSVPAFSVVLASQAAPSSCDIMFVDSKFIERE